VFFPVRTGKEEEKARGGHLLPQRGVSEGMFLFIFLVLWSRGKGRGDSPHRRDLFFFCPLSSSSRREGGAPARVKERLLEDREGVGGGVGEQPQLIINYIGE